MILSKEDLTKSLIDTMGGKADTSAGPACAGREEDELRTEEVARFRMGTETVEVVIAIVEVAMISVEEASFEFAYLSVKMLRAFLFNSASLIYQCF